ARRDHRALDAMRAPLPQHLANREHGLAAGFMVDRDRVEERLDALRCGEARELRVLRRGAPEVVRPREAWSCRPRIPQEDLDARLFCVAASCAHGFPHDRRPLLGTQTSRGVPCPDATKATSTARP